VRADGVDSEFFESGRPQAAFAALGASLAIWCFDPYLTHSYYVASKQRRHKL
jgi:hypothetical protein